MSNQKKDQVELARSIQQACMSSVGVLDSGFLCRSVSVLNAKPPLCIPAETALGDVVALLRSNKVGCVLVVGADGKLSGIFSERDLLIKAMDSYESKKHLAVEQFMTREPVTERPDATIAFALNLMSSGGFRHLPLVDESNIPVGIISVKDVVDFIVERFTSSLLNLELPA
jgi:CBS domain-containing protein